MSGTSTGANPAATTAGLASLGGASDMLSISAAAKAMPSELKAGPPIDTDAVDRIRIAISENRYPVDLKAITEALFQNFLEITS
jgi:flagellar biosynthesis anti-sigma factor FlgM